MARRTSSPAAAVVNGDAAPEMHQLWGQQMTLAAEQFTSMAQIYNQMLSSLLDAERQWLEQWESSAADAARGWLERGAAPAPWSELTRVWIDAINHDLRH